MRATGSSGPAGGLGGTNGEHDWHGREFGRETGREFGTEYDGSESGGDLGMLYAGELKTPFAAGEDVESMKAMLADAKPEQVLAVADGWAHVHDRLVDGSGSIKGEFDRTVAHVLQHWEGEAAEAFARAAAEISKQLADCGTFARYTSAAMRHAGERLSEVKPQIDAIGKRGGFEGVVNSVSEEFTGRRRQLDAGFRGLNDGRRGGTHAPGRDGETDEEGDGGTRRAVALMVDLALTYNSQTQAMNSWQKKLPSGPGGGGGEYPGEPGGFPPYHGPMRPGEPAPGAAAVAAARAASAATAGRRVPGSAAPAVLTGSADAGRSASGAASGAGAAAPSRMRSDGVSGGTATAPGPGAAHAAPPAGTPGATVAQGAAGPGAGPAGGFTGGLGMHSGPAFGARSARGGGPRPAGAAGGAAPAGLGAGPAPGSASGTVPGGTAGGSPEAATGRGLHFSRGGSSAGEPGREDGPLGAGGAIGPVRSDDVGQTGTAPAWRANKYDPCPLDEESDETNPYFRLRDGEG